MTDFTVYSEDCHQTMNVVGKVVNVMSGNIRMRRIAGTLLYLLGQYYVQGNKLINQM